MLPTSSNLGLNRQCFFLPDQHPFQYGPQSDLTDLRFNVLGPRKHGSALASRLEETATDDSLQRFEGRTLVADQLALMARGLIDGFIANPVDVFFHTPPEVLAGGLKLAGCLEAQPFTLEVRSDHSQTRQRLLGLTSAMQSSLLTNYAANYLPYLTPALVHSLLIEPDWPKTAAGADLTL